MVSLGHNVLNIFVILKFSNHTNIWTLQLQKIHDDMTVEIVNI